MNLAGTTFRVVSNSSHGSVNTKTEMHFTSDDGIVTASYGGGSVVSGHLIGRRVGEEIDMLYHSVDTNAQIQAGKARARFAVDGEDQMRMYLNWQWLTGDQSSGQSEWELV